MSVAARPRHRARSARYAVRADSGDGAACASGRRAARPPTGTRSSSSSSTGTRRLTVDGQAVDAPAGTAVFVRDAGRDAGSAVAGAIELTTLLLVGGRRREAWRPTPGEATAEFWPLYEAKDYEGALAVVRQALEEYPGNPLAHYNVACMASLLGRPDDALEAPAGRGRRVSGSTSRTPAPTTISPQSGTIRASWKLVGESKQASRFGCLGAEGTYGRPPRHAPSGIRTRATTLKGWRPRPLVDGGEAGRE